MFIADPTIRITMHFRDDDGAVSTTIINLSAAALPVAGAFAVAVAPLYQPVSNCALFKISISLRYLADTEIPGAPGSDRNRRTVFLFQAIGGKYTFSLPGVIGSKLLQPPDPFAYVQLNTADPEIAAVIAAMLTGLGGVQPCAPWNPERPGNGSAGGSWGGDGAGGSWGGGSAGGSWGGGSAGGSWGGDGDLEPEDYSWRGADITELLAAYWGYERER